MVILISHDLRTYCGGVYLLSQLVPKFRYSSAKTRHRVNDARWRIRRRITPGIRAINNLAQGTAVNRLLQASQVRWRRGAGGGVAGGIG
ncbi:hypothetical protein J6590_011709 [Homalodisca vitripennis]|nr:hypothetical protein J6590_011709 [Homalodisca vitripennis]